MSDKRKNKKKEGRVKKIKVNFYNEKYDYPKLSGRK